MSDDGLVRVQTNFGGMWLVHFQKILANSDTSSNNYICIELKTPLTNSGYIPWEELETPDDR